MITCEEQKTKPEGCEHCPIDHDGNRMQSECEYFWKPDHVITWDKFVRELTGEPWDVYKVEGPPFLVKILLSVLEERNLRGQE